MNNVLNIMKSRVLLYCTLLVIVCSCIKAVRQSENFDIVETNEYVNIYNSKGKLDSVKITQKQLMYESNVLTSVNIYTGLHTYTYQNNSLYSITETSEPKRNIIRTTYYKDKSEETIELRNNKDTINYYFYQYRDDDKKQLEYTRMIQRLNGKPIIDIDINDNYEKWCFYHKDYLFKIIRHDFNSSQTEETYFFDTIPDKEDLQSIPKSKNKQFIKYHTYNTINDTLIEKYFTNGEVDMVVKKYNDNGKEIEHTCATDGFEILHIRYKEKDMDVTVTSSPFMGNSTDSVYTKNGKDMRVVRVDDEARCLITYDYDRYGNLTKEVRKPSSFNDYNMKAQNQ